MLGRTIEQITCLINTIVKLISYELENGELTKKSHLNKKAETKNLKQTKSYLFQLPSINTDAHTDSLLQTKLTARV